MAAKRFIYLTLADAIDRLVHAALCEKQIDSGFSIWCISVLLLSPLCRRTKTAYQTTDSAARGTSNVMKEVMQEGTLGGTRHERGKMYCKKLNIR